MHAVAHTLLRFGAALALASCATATRTTVDYFYIISDPPGANAATTNGARCVTPCTLVIPRNADFDVTLSREGYQEWNGRITRTAHRRGAVEQAGDTAGGVVGGAAGGFAVAGASGEVALSMSGGVAVTSAGITIVTGGAILGALAPLAVDAATGANFDFTPNPLVVTLTPIGNEAEQ